MSGYGSTGFDSTVCDSGLAIRRRAMSPKLKPLILPQLVEDRRKAEDERREDVRREEIRQEEIRQEVRQEEIRLQDLRLQDTTPDPDSDHTYIYYTHHSSSSSSDVASPSPVTPTFSRSGHSRFSGSTSSLEQMAPSCQDSPASPTQAAHKGSKSQLPDVQEDPLREDEDNSAVDHGLYGCLCDEPCVHSGVGSVQTTVRYMGTDIDYDLGFLSDGDFPDAVARPKRRRNGSDSTFTGWGRHIGSRFPALSRWRSMGSKRNDLSFSPASDPSLDQRLGLGLSHTASSRSSSMSAPPRRVSARSADHAPMPPTPTLSFYDSTDSLALSSAVDLDKASVRKDIERDRAMATTPLLPPLMTDPPPSSVPSSLQVSPLQSPTVAPSAPPSIPEAASPQLYSSPPLSTKPSISSFRPAIPPMSLPLPVSSPSETASPMPNLMEHDKWCDLLGHANFTIVPRPSRPAEATLEALSAVRGDWDLARVNYTKHLVRTGEHYGATSNTYSLTQAKWSEIESEWHAVEDDLIERIVQSGSEEASAALTRRAQEDVLPAAIPRLLDAEGKFPERGDVDIVGPMQRHASMTHEFATDDKKNVGAWFKNLAGRVGLRK